MELQFINVFVLLEFLVNLIVDHCISIIWHFLQDRFSLPNSMAHLDSVIVCLLLSLSLAFASGRVTIFTSGIYKRYKVRKRVQPFLKEQLRKLDSYNELNALLLNF